VLLQHCSTDGLLIGWMTRSKTRATGKGRTHLFGARTHLFGARTHLFGARTHLFGARAHLPGSNMLSE
jgi:hypothetical protein